MNDISTVELQSDFFDIKVATLTDKTQLDLRLREDFILTKSLPATISTLSVFLPSIFQHLCLNPKGLPFELEVENTEFGHLFEHILLEYLQLNSPKQTIYEGVTRWNWQKEPKGEFHIQINVTEQDRELLLSMIDKTIVLINQIITSSLMLTQAVVTQI